MKTTTTNFVSHNAHLIPVTKAAIPVGTKFTCVHSDGYIANEVIDGSYEYSYRHFYTCESGATYSENDLVRLRPDLFEN